jgi:DNA-binding NarL/FixJ family response regulator
LCSRTIEFVSKQDDNKTDKLIRALVKVGETRKLPFKILLLEDEVLCRASIIKTVHNHKELKPNVGLYEAPNVEDALKIFQHYDVEFAVVDIDLGEELTGYDFIEQSKAITTDLKYLINSNRFSQNNQEEANKLGVFGFAQKPLSLADFVSFLCQIPFNE